MAKQSTPKQPQRYGRVLVAIAVALLLGIIAAIFVYTLPSATNHNTAAPSAEEKVSSAITDFFAALQSVNLPKLQAATCGQLHDFYAGTDQNTITTARDGLIAQKRFPLLDQVQKVIISGKTAEANVTTYFSDAPDNKITNLINLSEVDGDWKICHS
ncbi:MAG: hypothetical protein ACRCSF_01865 [Mycobacteriaceae bacterium]